MRRTTLLLGILAAVAWLWSLGGTSPVTAAKSPTAELQQALAGSGFELTPVSPDDMAATALSIEPARAATIAVDAFGQVSSPVVYLGLLTVRGSHLGGPDTALTIENQAVYAVQMTGLNLPPLGAPATQQNVHHELVVFVDAASGALLLATTVR